MEGRIHTKAPKTFPSILVQQQFLPTGEDNEKYLKFYPDILILQKKKIVCHPNFTILVSMCI